jgi:anti-sigma regulatory factor (Ser/Thr protein kinase)
VEAELEVALPLTPLAPRAARRAVDELATGLPGEVIEDLRLLVSELVTNSVRHAGLSEHETVQLHISRTDDCIRVEVIDPGEGFDADDDPLPRAAGGGMGLYLVRRLAHRWGVVRNTLTRVWFEIRLA